VRDGEVTGRVGVVAVMGVGSGWEGEGEVGGVETASTCFIFEAVLVCGMVLFLVVELGLVSCC